MKKSTKGFTLIELLVVIAIIAILAAILFPVFAQAREKARQSTCASNLKQIALAVLQYTQDYDEFYPLENNLKGSSPAVPGLFYCGGSGTTNQLYYSWPDRLYPYLKSTAIFNCPDGASASVEGGGHPETAYCHYGLNIFLSQYANGNTGLAGTTLYGTYSTANVQRPASIILLGDYSGHGGVQVGEESVDFNFGSDSVDYYITPAATASAASWECANTTARCFYDSVSLRHQTGANYAFCDGHVKFLGMTVDSNGWKHSALYDALYDNLGGNTNDFKETNWGAAANAVAKTYWCPNQ
jgi:prepilin-type N-terminal cleavage/methylation domain-containing protein/prepilin-type processing-associated H-X9-DG protein